ncbi:MAG: hypothetical protein ACLUR5_06640 [Eubacterium ventriosum]
MAEPTKEQLADENAELKAELEAQKKKVAEQEAQIAAAKEREAQAEKEAKALIAGKGVPANPDARKESQVHIPYYQRKNADKDIIISVNGRDYQIQRGVEVSVPKFLVEAYYCSEGAKDEADNYIEEVAE